ncbi:Lrp/AsnC family transcriptional regulator [Temperatibacter marinus]|uniref:Lrp/AsnC family transcriptional regulator n=1 Tax=Temperatibacter marinus TaxID=1456591 RepID=A0AA52EDG3_9PROT|nr:Lrp/AsnC family transcriptional regulator [Temperatibacter marinus]WND03437.1 Lrp/AsnC family transcriptional regulator [Temperatibacter marinus]
MISLDQKDKDILDLIIEDSKLSHQQIAEKINSSQASVWRRIKALEDMEVITGYGAKVNHEKLGFEMVAFAMITLNRHSRDTVGKFETAMQMSKAVLECHSITGQADYILKIQAHTIRQYEFFLNDELFRTPGVEHVQTSISLRPVKS